MKTNYFTFGQGHRHTRDGIVFHHNIVVSITAEDPRQWMFFLFGDKWAMQYEPDKLDLSYFPDGVIRFYFPDTASVLPGYEKEMEYYKKHTDPGAVEQYTQFVGSRLKDPNEILKTLTPLKINLLHGLSGLFRELAELADPINAHVFYNKPLDIKNPAEELGDVLFFFFVLCIATNHDFFDIVDANIQKLSKRYPKGYSDKDAILRVDKNELETTQQSI